MGNQPRWVRRLLDLAILLLAVKKLNEWFGAREAASTPVRRSPDTAVGGAPPSATKATGEWSQVLKWPWVRENILWILGLMPVVLVCFRIFYVSGADPIAMRLLVTNLDIVQISIVTLLSLVPVALFYSGLVILERVFFDVPGENLPPWVGVVGLFSSVVGFMLMNRDSANGIARGLGIYLLLALLISYFVRRKGGPRLVIFGGLLVGLSMLQSLSASTDHWLPAENIKVENLGTRTGFVIEENESEATVQWYRGPVEFVDGSQIQDRDFCTLGLPQLWLTSDL